MPLGSARALTHHGLLPSPAFPLPLMGKYVTKRGGLEVAASAPPVQRGDVAPVPSPIYPWITTVCIAISRILCSLIHLRHSHAVCSGLQTYGAFGGVAS